MAPGRAGGMGAATVFDTPHTTYSENATYLRDRSKFMSQINHLSENVPGTLILNDPLTDLAFDRGET